MANPNVAQRHSTVFSTGLNTGDGDLQGVVATNSEGFYGATPVAQQGPISISTGTTAQVITALGALGLIKTVA